MPSQAPRPFALSAFSLCIVGLLSRKLVRNERHPRLSAFIGGYSFMAEAGDDG
jgi:hypothetical protein